MATVKIQWSYPAAGYYLGVLHWDIHLLVPIHPSVWVMENGNQTQEKQPSVKVRIKRSLYSTPLVPPDVIVGITVIGAPFSSLTVYSHLRILPIKLQVSSNWSPIWHTGATTEGEISTTPELATRNDTGLLKGISMQLNISHTYIMPFTTSVAFEDNSEASSTIFIWY